MDIPNAVRLFDDICSYEEGLAESLFKLHSPPKGGDVEADRFKFYVDRAAHDNLVSNLDEENCKKYMAAMRIIFAQRTSPEPSAPSDHYYFQTGAPGETLVYLDPEGFEDALYYIKKTGNPGLPFVGEGIVENQHVDLDLLENLVLTMLILASIGSTPCICCGSFYPPLTFVKSEPTKKDKVARIIYGVSLVYNVFCRLLFGEMLEMASYDYSETCHKVGMDFNTQEGLQRFFDAYHSMYDIAEIMGLKIKSNDIRGWEYSVKPEMNKIWHACRIEAAYVTHSNDVTPRYTRDTMRYHLVVNRFCIAYESSRIVCHSNGKLSFSKNYVQWSGKPSTHLENSDQRAALAMVANGFMECYELIEKPRVVETPFGLCFFSNIRQLEVVHRGIEYDELVYWGSPLAATNGDDCLEIYSEESDKWYKENGFTITDDRVMDYDVVYFCSQKLVYDNEEIQHYHVPDGIAKILYNLFAATDPAAVNGILYHLRYHPARFSIHRLVKLMANKQAILDRLELL